MDMGLADLLGFQLNYSIGRRKKFCMHQIFNSDWLLILILRDMAGYEEDLSIQFGCVRCC